MPVRDLSFQTPPTFHQDTRFENQPEEDQYGDDVFENSDSRLHDDYEDVSDSIPYYRFLDINSLKSDPNHYESLEKQLQTFAHYPHQNIPRYEFAKTGFLYLCEQSDPSLIIVVCVWCGLVLEDLDFYFRPGTFHKSVIEREGRECPFLSRDCSENRMFSSQNALAYDELTPSCDTKPVPSEVSLPQLYRKERYKEIRADRQTITKDIHTHCADTKHEDFRCSTFSSLNKRSISELAAAGFVKKGTGDTVECAFCKVQISNWDSISLSPLEIHQEKSSNCSFANGQGDEVQCYWCGQKISNWCSGEDIWVRHVRVSPDCRLVVEKKGENFVNRTLHDFGRLEQSHTVPQINVTRRMIRPRLESPVSQVLLSLKIPEHLVRDAISHRIACSLEDFQSVLELMEAVLDRYERQRPKDFQSVTKQIEAVLDGQPLPKYYFREPIATNIPEIPINDSDKAQQIKSLLTCKICLDNIVGVVFLPCGHHVSCTQCAPAMTNCPICRTEVRATVVSHIT